MYFILTWVHARMPLKKFTKKKLVAKIKVLSYFCNGLPHVF